MDLATALDYVRDHAVAMLQTPGADLTAVAVSTKEGVPITDAKDFTVTAFVERKLTKREMTRAKVQPFDQVFAAAAGGVKTRKVDFDVVESGTPFRTLSGLGLNVPAAQRGVYGGTTPTVDTQKFFTALRSGIGITNPDGDYPSRLSVGTLGFFVRDPAGGVHLVSNNHVIGKSADKAAAPKVVGNPVVQPGTLDLTAGELAANPTQADLIKAYQIGAVSGVVPLQFLGAKAIPINTMDAAAALLTVPNPRTLADLARAGFGGGILGTGSYPPSPTDPNEVTGDARVYKAGRTTGYTEGVVIGLAGVATIDYPGGAAFFNNQLVIRGTPDNDGPFSAAGDSGSGILNARHELVGLLFAGSTMQTLANPVADVLTQLAAAMGVAALTVLTV